MYVTSYVKHVLSLARNQNFFGKMRGSQATDFIVITRKVSVSTDIVRLLILNLTVLQTIEYADGTPAYASQLAKDVSVFLKWAGEPEYDQRQLMLIKV